MGGQYLVELQRRAGCVVTFMKVYNMVLSCFLQEKSYSIPTEECCGLREPRDALALLSPRQAPPLLPDAQEGDDFPVPPSPPFGGPCRQSAGSLSTDAFRCTAVRC